MSPLSNRSSPRSNSGCLGKNRVTSKVNRRAAIDLIRLANSKRKLYVVLCQYGIEPVRKSQFNEWGEHIICPFPDHKGGNERTPSFGYSFVRDAFFCFGCKKSGRAVEFLAHIKQTNKTVIARSILDEAGIYNVDFTDLPRDDNPEIERNLFEFCKYIQQLMYKYKNDLHSLDQIEKINIWFDKFLCIKLANNNLTLEELEGTIIKLKEYLEPYE